MDGHLLPLHELTTSTRALGDNHYNCPVVAYYPEIIAANMPMLGGVTLHQRLCWACTSGADFPEKSDWPFWQRYFDGHHTCADVKRGGGPGLCRAGGVSCAPCGKRAMSIIAGARSEGKPIIVPGRAALPRRSGDQPRHRPAASTRLGLAVDLGGLPERQGERFPAHVLNQWTYHARLYAAAKYIGTQPDMELVQLISFGCGLDAITSDEVPRDHRGASGKIYTQIKIDEITNLGTVKVRLTKPAGRAWNRRRDKTPWQN